MRLVELIIGNTVSKSLPETFLQVNRFQQVIAAVRASIIRRTLPLSGTGLDACSWPIAACRELTVEARVGTLWTWAPRTAVIAYDSERSTGKTQANFFLPRQSGPMTGRRIFESQDAIAIRST